jgi:hypothetical protein
MKIETLPVMLVFLLTISGCVSRPGDSTESASGEKYEIANPAAVYCEEMGYKYTIVGSNNGQHGVCTFPDGSKCDAWDFLNGNCGVNFSYCEKSGGKLISGKNCSFSSECSFCILSDGFKKLEWEHFRENVLSGRDW